MNINEFKKNINIEESAKYWKPGFIVIEDFLNYNGKDRKDFIAMEKRDVKKYIKKKFIEEGYSMQYKDGYIILYCDREDFKEYSAIFNISPKEIF